MCVSRVDLCWQAQHLLASGDGVGGSLCGAVAGRFGAVVGLLARFCARVFVTFRSPVRVSGRGGAVRIRPQEFFFPSC